MNEHADTTNKEIDQDARTAAQLGPAPAVAAAAAAPIRYTPPWIWAWLVPAVALVLLIMARRIWDPL